jgi:hypothetical protein
MTQHDATSRPRFALRLAIGATLLLVAQVAVYLLILEDTVGGVSLLRAAPAPDPSMTLDARVVLLRSDATARLLSGETYELRLRAWSEALSGLGVPHEVVRERALGSELRGATALVLPGAACLGEGEREAVRAFLKRGRGVVATGAVGSRDADCSWRGWDFLEELTGGEHAESAAPPGAVYAAFRGDGFSQAALPAGYRLELPFQQLVTMHSPHPAAHAADWRLRPLDTDRAEVSALVTHGTSGTGRVVWLGFDESGVGRREPPQLLLESYLATSALWASRQPIATVATWPARRPAAATVVVVAGHDDRRLAALSGVLREGRVPATYVFDDAKPRFGEGWRGDIATTGGPGEPFAGQPLVRQRDRLSEARRLLAASVPGGRLTGLMPAAGATDAATIHAAAAEGLAYTLGELTSLRATPERVEVGSPLLSVLPGTPVVRFFQVASDDQEALASTGDPGAYWTAELDRIVELGGLYPLTLHADLAGSAELLDGVRAVLSEASRRGAWIASAADVAQWWNAREGLHVSATRLSPYRVQVDLSNHGQEHARDVVVSVELPYAPRRLSLRSPVMQLRLPKTEQQGEVLRLHFPDVAPQSNHTYVVSLDE